MMGQGRKTSNSVSTTLNPRGIIPTICQDSVSNRMVCPMTLRCPPNCRCQKP